MNLFVQQSSWPSIIVLGISGWFIIFWISYVFQLKKTRLRLLQAHHSSSPLSTYTSYSFTAPLTLFLPTDGSGSSSLSDEQCECYRRFFLKLFFSSLVHIFPDMPQLFATHRTSGNPTFGDKRPENEPGHVLTELNQSLSRLLFLPISLFSGKTSKHEADITQTTKLSEGS